MKKGTVENFRMELDGQTYKVRREHIDQYAANVDVFNLDGTVPKSETALVYDAMRMYRGESLNPSRNPKLTKV